MSPAPESHHIDAANDILNFAPVFEEHDLIAIVTGVSALFLLLLFSLKEPVANLSMASDVLALAWPERWIQHRRGV